MEQKSDTLEQELVQACNFQLQEAQPGEWNMVRLGYITGSLMKRMC